MMMASLRAVAMTAFLGPMRRARTVYRRRRRGSRRIAVQAASVRRERMWALPWRVIRPRRTLSPELYSAGVRPSQEAKFRAVGNRSTPLMSARMARVVRAPIPGMDWRSMSGAWKAGRSNTFRRSRSHFWTWSARASITATTCRIAQQFSSGSSRERTKSSRKVGPQRSSGYDTFRKSSLTFTRRIIPVRGQSVAAWSGPDP
jgi:hypothetical protein